jgi:hypothetical protein
MLTTALFADNYMFVIDDSITFECRDFEAVELIQKNKTYGLELTFSDEGLEKIYNLTKNRVGKKLGFIVNDVKVFFNVPINDTLGQSIKTMLMATKNKNDALLVKNSFVHCNFKK